MRTQAEAKRWQAESAAAGQKAEELEGALQVVKPLFSRSTTGEFEFSPQLSSTAPPPPGRRRRN
eukprot:4148116-Pyramimonas_sp.AAC.1